MLRSKLESRAILSAGYDPITQTLELEFNSGRVYEYTDVPESVYAWLLRTPGKGSYVSRMINGRYPYRDITVEGPKQTMSLEEALRASVAGLEHKGG